MVNWPSKFSGICSEDGFLLGIHGTYLHSSITLAPIITHPPHQPSALHVASQPTSMSLFKQQIGRNEMKIEAPTARDGIPS